MVLLVSWAQITDSRRPAALRGRPAIGGLPQGGKSRVPEVAGALGWRADMFTRSLRRAGIFIQHMKQMEKFLLISIINTLLLPQVGVIQKVQRSLSENKKAINQTANRCLCTCTCTHVSFVCRYVCRHMCTHISFIYNVNRIYISFSPESQSCLKK